MIMEVWIARHSQNMKGGLSSVMKEFDGNKKVNGRKRHIVTDINGW